MNLLLTNLITEGIREKTCESLLSDIIRNTKYENHVFIAGGYVRDELLGLDPKDIDIVIDLPNGGIEFTIWLAKKLNIFKDKSNPVIFQNFGTSKLSLNGITYNGVDISSIDIEAVMTRGENYNLNSRKPEVFYGNLKTDVERRDSTINSLLKNVSTGEILDLTGRGKMDLRMGILRTPVDPDITFSDDPLRMMRFIRQATKYNWEIDGKSLEGIKRNAYRIDIVSKERIRDELNKILTTANPDRGIDFLKTTGLLKYILPELEKSVNMTQNSHHKKDVFGHTLDVLKNTQPDLVQRLMGLFHDIGKTITKTVEPTGIHFYGHEEASEKITDEVMRRLKYPTDLINAVKIGVRNHMRLKQAGDTAVNLSDKALRKFKLEIGDHLENVLNLIHADNISHSDSSSMPNQIFNIRKRLESLKNIPKKPELPINGNDLISLGIKQGPMFKKILSAITDAWFENPQLTKDEAITIAKKVSGI